MTLLRKLWTEDDGAVITTEFLLIVAVLFVGLIPAFVGFRNLLAAAMLSVGDLMQGLIAGTSADGMAVTGPDGRVLGSTPAITGGRVAPLQMTSIPADPYGYQGWQQPSYYGNGYPTPAP